MTIYLTEEEREYLKIEKGELVLSKDAPKELKEKFKKFKEYKKPNNTPNTYINIRI